MEYFVRRVRSLCHLKSIGVHRKASSKLKTIIILHEYCDKTGRENIGVENARFFVSTRTAAAGGGAEYFSK